MKFNSLKNNKISNNEKNRSLLPVDTYFSDAKKIYFFLTFVLSSLYLLFQDLHFLLEVLKLRVPPYSAPGPVIIQSNDTII